MSECLSGWMRIDDGLVVVPLLIFVILVMRCFLLLNQPLPHLTFQTFEMHKRRTTHADTHRSLAETVLKHIQQPGYRVYGDKSTRL